MTKKQERRWSNPVAKHAHKFNKSLRMDTKAAKIKRGHVKHKGTEVSYEL